nr:nucleoside hydrolase [Planctomycetota bacterium]
MPHALRILLFAVLACAPCAVLPALEHVLFDTDLGDDVDDAGTFAVMHALADRGEIAILGVGIVNGNVHAVPCADALNTFYGRPDLPLGTIKVGAPINHNTFRMGDLAAQYPHDLTQAAAPDVVPMYRRILAAQSDRSVTLVVVGQATNIANLLKSQPDTISPLNGVALMRQKIKIYSSGGNGRATLPYGDAGWNYQNDRQAAWYELEHLPSEFPTVEAGGSGLRMVIGSCYLQAPPDHMVRKAYEYYFGGVAKDRPTWDQMRMLYGARPGGRGMWDRSADGNMTLDVATGILAWTATPNRNRSYAYVNDAATVQAQMTELMMHMPASTPTAITAPAAGTTLSAGQQVTVTGTGSNPTWSIDILEDGQPAFASGAGPSFTFGSLVDSGAVFGARSNGQSYGWLGSANGETRERGVHADQRYDTLNHMQNLGTARTWEIALANGEYDVRLVMGDPQFAHQTNHVFLEAARQADPDGIDLFDEYAVKTTVADGQLTIRPDVNAGPGAKIVFIDITRVPIPSSQPIAVNFQPAGVPIPVGYRADTGAAFGDRGDGLAFGWLDGANDTARDRASHADQRYDTFIHMQKTTPRTWEVAVPNGSYAVHLVMGDARYADQTNHVFVEGTRQADPDGIDLFDEYDVVVQVADGRLTIAPDANLQAGAKIGFIEIRPVPV